ncbi:MAG TPA: hypothetical protein VM187_09405 [Niastella sp.]|nr:hypothetical protein [Niastella sp.]
MAKLEGTIQLTGSIQNMSFYKMRGSDKIIVRKKGGPSKKQVKNARNFENTRRNNMEFGGRALAAATIKGYLHPLLFLADYNIVGPLNALLRPIQKMDTTSGWGKRHVLLTKQPRLLEGFTLNRRYLFETIVRTPVVCNLQGEQVHINLPALMPGINFMSPGNYPYYRFIGTAGVVPDIYYTDHGYQLKDRESSYFEMIESEWLPVNAPAAAQSLTIHGLPENKPAGCSIMVAIGVAFGKLQGDTIVPEKYVGGAKVMMVV